MKLSVFVAALLALFLTACGSADMGDPADVSDECEFGIDGNGNCLAEGASALPYGGGSKPGH